MADIGSRDANRSVTIGAASNAADRAYVAAWADPTTHRLLTNTTINGVTISSLGATPTLALDVAIVDGSGNQITSFGGGTQYTDAASTPAHPTGTMPVFNNAGTISQVSNTIGLPVNVVAGGGGGGPSDTAASASASESDTARQKVTSALRLYDTSQSAGSRLVTAKGDQTNGLWVSVKATQTTSTSSYPMYDRRDIGLTSLQTDSAGALQTFSEVTTDEGTSRVNFTGSSLSTSPGTATFTNGSTAVTGTGFTTVDVFYMDYIKLGADSESAWAQVSFVNSDTSITLTSPYTGTGGTGTYNLSPAATITGTGATISVASGQATIALGTNTSAATNLYRSAGVPSLRNTAWSTQLSISQRIANQDIYIGIESATSAPRYFSRFHFTGTTNTQVITETAYNPTTGPSASEIESNTITLPGGANTASINTYKIMSEVDQVYFYINGVLVATHSARLPHIAAQSYYANIRGVNSGSITATSIVCNYVFLRNYERLDLVNNNSVNVSQLAGTTTDTNSGTKSAGTLRVVLATDQPQLTNALKVDGSAVTQPVSGTVSITANSSVNVAQIAGTTTSTAASGVQLVGVADGTGNALTSNSTTYTAKKALDGNLLGTLGTAFSTAGKVDVKGADGDVFVRQATASNLNAQVVGNVASGSSASGNPVQVGGIAKTSLPTAVSDAQVVENMLDKFGRQVMLPTTIRDLIGTQTTTISASTSETTIVTAAASTFNDLMLLVISNTSASTTTRIDFRDTTAGTVLFSIFSPAADTRGFNIGGVAIPQTSVNTNWTAQCATSTTDIRIYAVFAKNK